MEKVNERHRKRDKKRWSKELKIIHSYPKMDLGTTSQNIFTQRCYVAKGNL